MRKRYYYRVCEKCGARLDPGEHCTCEQEINDMIAHNGEMLEELLDAIRELR